MIVGERDKRTELSTKHSFTACFNPLKFVGGVSVLVPRYLIELNARGTLPIFANLSFKISSGLFRFSVSVRKL